jgi:hypothetical protein
MSTTVSNVSYSEYWKVKGLDLSMTSFISKDSAELESECRCGALYSDRSIGGTAVAKAQSVQGLCYASDDRTRCRSTVTRALSLLQCPDRHCGPLSLLFSEYRDVPSPRVKQPVCEADHSPTPTPTAQVKKVWNCTSTSSHVCMV